MRMWAAGGVEQQIRLSVGASILLEMCWKISPLHWECFLRFRLKVAICLTFVSAVYHIHYELSMSYRKHDIQYFRVKQ